MDRNWASNPNYDGTSLDPSEPFVVAGASRLGMQKVHAAPAIFVVADERNPVKKLTTERQVGR